MTNEADVEVRSAATDAIGAAMAVIGEKPALTMLGDIAGDAGKMAKVRRDWDVTCGDDGICRSARWLTRCVPNCHRRRHRRHPPRHLPRLPRLLPR